MPWIVGLDEAGYGPNLGPFVMSAVCLQVPVGVEESCPWSLLEVALCRRADHHAGDPRLIVDDSKAVYNGKQGVSGLEQNLWPFLWPTPEIASLNLEEYWLRWVHTPVDAARDEPWIEMSCPLPISEQTLEKARSTAAVLHAQLDRHELRLASMRSVVVFPREFNVLAQQTKAAVPLAAVERLLQALPCTRQEDVLIVVDRLGGRQHYQPFLQRLFPDWLVMCRGEMARCSSYQVGPHWTMQFQVRADQECFSVALASMLSKYVREVLMLHFNRYWQRQVPLLKPTAGYPVDAARFWEATAQARQRLGVEDGVWWRHK